LTRVIDGISEYCAESGVTRVRDLIGALKTT
jgi:hypothetical protein